MAVPIGGGFVRFHIGNWARTDTTFTVLAEYTAYDGSTLSFGVKAQSGPMPTAKGAFTPNILSSTFRGAIWSSGGGYSARYSVGTVVLTSENEVPDNPTS